MKPKFFKDQSDFRKWLSENHKKETELVVGSAIPPLANGLRETGPAASNMARLPEPDADLVDLFGLAQQRLVTVWLLSTSARY